MKKLTSLFVILALLMLCACGSKTGATADGAAAPGVRNWPDTHLLGDDVEITDPLDARYTM